MPITAGWLALLIGLADVVSAVIPRLQLVHRLHRITPFVPGVLTNVTFTADVIIGLLLLMLSHGLRRRKRRAWQATCLLLTFSVLIHTVHAPYLAPGVISAILLGGLLFYREEFYAVGDARTRWQAARVFVCLLIADVAIGLTYMLLVHGLAQNYSVWQRIVHTVYGLVGVTGPVRFVPGVEQLHDCALPHWRSPRTVSLSIAPWAAPRTRFRTQHLVLLPAPQPFTWKLKSAIAGQWRGFVSGARAPC